MVEQLENGDVASLERSKLTVAAGFWFQNLQISMWWGVSFKAMWERQIDRDDG